MGCWIPGPARYCWPAKPKGKPEPAISVTEEPKPRRTRRTKKIED